MSCHVMRFSHTYYICITSSTGSMHIPYSNLISRVTTPVPAAHSRYGLLPPPHSGSHRHYTHTSPPLPVSRCESNPHLGVRVPHVPIYPQLPLPHARPPHGGQVAHLDVPAATSGQRLRRRGRVVGRFVAPLVLPSTAREKRAYGIYVST